MRRDKLQASANMQPRSRCRMKVRKRAEATIRIVLMTHPAQATSIPSRPALAIGCQAPILASPQYVYHLSWQPCRLWQTFDISGGAIQIYCEGHEVLSLNGVQRGCWVRSG